MEGLYNLHFVVSENWNVCPHVCEKLVLEVDTILFIIVQLRTIDLLANA